MAVAARTAEAVLRLKPLRVAAATAAAAGPTAVEAALRSAAVAAVTAVAGR